MSAQFLSVLRQALKTFDRSNHANFSANIQQLKLLTEQISYRDLHIHETTFERTIRAPCTYMHIFQDDVISLSVFVLRSGYTLPLHDHPGMFGLLRGLFGQLRVQSYSAPDLDETTHCDINPPNQLQVIVEEPCLIQTDSECAMLTPRERNFHEITAINGIAAFFDILSPPYDVDISTDIKQRRCNFYRPIPGSRTESSNATQLTLQNIPSPLDYFCDVADTPDEVLEQINLAFSEAKDIQ